MAARLAARGAVDSNRLAADIHPVRGGLGGYGYGRGAVAALAEVKQPARLRKVGSPCDTVPPTAAGGCRLAAEGGEATATIGGHSRNPFPRPCRAL